MKENEHPGDIAEELKENEKCQEEMVVACQTVGGFAKTELTIDERRAALAHMLKEFNRFFGKCLKSPEFKNVKNEFGRYNADKMIENYRVNEEKIGLKIKDLEENVNKEECIEAGRNLARILKLIKDSMNRTLRRR